MTTTSDDDLPPNGGIHGIRLKTVTLNLMKPLACTDEERRMVAAHLRENNACHELDRRRRIDRPDPGQGMGIQIRPGRGMWIVANLFDHLDRVPFYGLQLLGDQTGLTQYPNMTDVWNAVQDDQREWANLAAEFDMATPQSRLYLKLEKRH